MTFMCAADYRAKARETMTNSYGMLLLIYFIYSVILSALSSVGFGILLLGGPLYVGFYSSYLAQYRTGKTGIEKLFDGFTSHLGERIVANLLVTLYTFLWSLLFVIPGIIKGYSYAMTYFIMQDHPELSAGEAIDRSKAMMNGHKWELFCLEFSFIGWFLLALCTCGVGFLLLAPYMEMAKTAFYENIKEG